ncbi:hypothetical protein ABGF48_02250 [Helcococcus bovis]|uniref:hypothetical protein n=1 Tax=Helcococcus bovis TaxID=3153252 RepID=UPI0038BCB041
MKKILLLVSLILFCTSCTNFKNQKKDEKTINYEDLKNNKTSLNEKFYNFYQYILKNYSLEDYNMVDSSGGELSKYILMVEPDITFNNKSARTDENDNTNVFFIKYTSKDNLKYKASVFINIYNNSNEVDRYTFDSYSFIPNSNSESTISNILKFKDYLIRITVNYDNNKIKKDSTQYYQDMLGVSSKVTKKLISILSNMK